MMKSGLLLIFSFSLSFPSSVLSAQSHCPDSDLFSSELEAVIAAMNHFNPDSIVEDREYMGTIFRSGQHFGFSVSAGSRHRDRVSIRVAKDDWDDIAAFWHTHGDSTPSNRYFSDDDTALVNRFRKPLYLGDYTGYLKRFSPGDRRLSPYAARRLGLPSRSGFAIGETVKNESGRVVRIQTRNNPLS